MAENTINDFNTLPEQVQINKEDIKKLSDSSNAQTEQLQTLSTKVDTNTTNIATNTSNIASNTESIDSIKQSYLLKSDASNTYVSKEDYDNRFEIARLTLTEDGFNKIKTMTENEGTAIITLNTPNDFTEQVPPINPNNMKEIRLNINYDVNTLYSNIHLVPNTTTNNYDNLQGSLDEYWYTGHAMLLLPSQNDGYFIIAYQKGVNLILRLIMHY